MSTHNDSPQLLQLSPVSQCEVPKAAAGVSRGGELRLTHSTDPCQERFTDTSTQDVRPASDVVGHPSEHLEPHTVCFLAAGLLITKFVDCTGY